MRGSFWCLHLLFHLSFQHNKLLKKRRFLFKANSAKTRNTGLKYFEYFDKCVPKPTVNRNALGTSIKRFTGVTWADFGFSVRHYDTTCVHFSPKYNQFGNLLRPKTLISGWASCMINCCSRGNYRLWELLGWRTEEEWQLRPQHLPATQTTIGRLEKVRSKHPQKNTFVDLFIFILPVVGVGICKVVGRIIVQIIRFSWCNVSHWCVLRLDLQKVLAIVSDW